MTTAKIVTLLAFGLLLCAMLLLSDSPAQAQSIAKDQEIAQRRGISGSLASGPEVPEGQQPVNKTQAMIGIGSVLVMIAVVKFW